MNAKFETIIRLLISGNGENPPLTGLEIKEQFRPEEKTQEAVGRNINAAFLIMLCGKTHPSYHEAEKFIEDLQNRGVCKDIVEFYHQGLTHISNEIEACYEENRRFKKDFDCLYEWIITNRNDSTNIEIINKVWGVFFPEGVGLFENKEQNIKSLRGKRGVRITRLNPSPINDPAREILFTSNILLTLPSSSKNSESNLPADLKVQLEEIKKEPQLFWYDHPIQVGVNIEKNEVIYGLKALGRAIAFEKKRGIVEKDLKVRCVLSVSVTHAGLREIAKPCIEDMFKKAGGFNHLHVYVFTESDTVNFVEELFAPAAEYYSGCEVRRALKKTIGVDGRYGRHYSFLKAVSALWQVFLDPRVRGTFKIDLDQVFPQERLVAETGNSAFEHLKTPLWGAEGIDEDEKLVKLGMLAGALVNQEDIARSLFYPDTGFPDESLFGDEWVFLSSLPQALSTEAEMMTRYGDDRLNGRDHCIQRIHVTGGTCGILVDSLRKYRPFTPGFIGRAEDQAYLLSILNPAPGASLRYVHKDGLIMRHDKEAVLKEEISRASLGKLIGDYIRILFFSYYARGLPLQIEKIKDLINPFTGCFVSHIPFTVVYLRLALKGACFFNEGKQKEGCDLLQLGAVRLNSMINELSKSPDILQEKYLIDKHAWDIFYDLLDKMETGIKKNESFALGLKEKAAALIKESEISL